MPLENVYNLSKNVIYLSLTTAREHQNTVQPLEFLNAISLPEQDLKQLSFCTSAKPAKVSQWVANLHVTQISQTAVVLYQNLPEVTRLKCDGRMRFEMLEMLRPATQNIIAGLTREFLNQPIALPEVAQKTAIIAQALQKHMVTGYIVAMRDMLDKKQMPGKAAGDFSHALHRAITGIGFILLRSYQLYSGTAPDLWRQLHQLYRLAEHFSLLDEAIDDQLFQKRSKTKIKTAYYRSLMLALTRPNQLGQNDVEITYGFCQELSLDLTVRNQLSEDSDTLYAVDLHSDKGPVNKSDLAQQQSHDILELNLQKVVLNLNNLLQKAEESTSSMPAPKVLIQHLIDAWSVIPNRVHDRRKVSSRADVCVGMREFHRFVRDSDTFEDFINAGGGDQVADINTEGLTPNDALNQDEHHQRSKTFPVSIQNVSRGGYCILWKNNMPTQVDSGELIGIRDSGRRSWVLGVVRWIRQCRQGAQLGIQILSDRPKAFGVAQFYEMGGYSEYKRALFLPPSKIDALPPTLLTQGLPLEPGDRIKIIDGQKEQTLKLDKSYFTTRYVKQFSFIAEAQDEE